MVRKYAPRFNRKTSISGPSNTGRKTPPYFPTRYPAFDSSYPIGSVWGTCDAALHRTSREVVILYTFTKYPGGDLQIEYGYLPHPECPVGEVGVRPAHAFSLKFFFEREVL